MTHVERPHPTHQHSANFPHLRNVVEEVQKRLKKEKESEAHRIFQEAQPHNSDDVTDKEPAPGIYAPGATGVIYCSDRAAQNGWKGNEDPDWCNAGQGAPETGPIPGGAERLKSIDLESYGDDIFEYAPTSGVKELREAVARLYNSDYRQGRTSQYTYKNVCIVPGGRAGLTRVAAIIGDVFAAYESMLAVFRRLIPIPSALNEKDNYTLDIDALQRSIKSQGITAIVASNPRNPIGLAVTGHKLEELVSLCHHGTTLILDEFYSHYNYLPGQEGESESAARYIQDVNKDSVILIDGFTKNWRYPGLRCCWVIAPEKVVSALSQSGSFLDGGCCHPIQRALVPLLEPGHVHREKIALQRHFKAKRDHCLDRFAKMGLPIKIPGTHTFYLWVDLSDLPEPLNAGLTFFEECLKEKVIVVPGIFFDVNPSNRRSLMDSPCHHFVRFSYGPPLAVLDKGLDGIERMLNRARAALEEKDHLHHDFGHSYEVNDEEHDEHPGAGS